MAHFLSAEIVGVGVPLGPLPDRCRRSPLYSSPKPSPLNSELNLRVPSIFTRISLLFRYVGRSTRLKQVCALGKPPSKPACPYLTRRSSKFFCVPR
jgi:hypothetical protein